MKVQIEMGELDAFYYKMISYLKNLISSVERHTDGNDELNNVLFSMDLLLMLMEEFGDVLDKEKIFEQVKTK